MTINSITIPDEEVAQFCERWGVTKLELFGSILRDDFLPTSDVDVLASFAPEVKRTLLDEAQMEMDLEAIIERPVHLVSRSAVENSRNAIRRRNILESAVMLHAQ